MTQEQAVGFLKARPVEFAQAVGFSKLTELHNGWIVDMITGTEDATLQAHRGSYKTTCVSVALSLMCILMPSQRTLFMRKTDTDVKEVINQVQNILMHPVTRYFVQCIWGVDLRFPTLNDSEITTSLCRDVKGTEQLTARGIKGSLTGKHFDRIFTDDIVNLEDRASRAERERTKAIYQEIQNLKNRGGRIYNTGTPWHKEDAFILMPSPQKWDCDSTGLMSEEEKKQLRERMAPSLWAANYELRHIASEDVIFTDPVTGADPALVENGIAHVDASYGGADGTAYTAAKRRDGKIYLFGKLWQKGVDECLDEIVALNNRFLVGKIYCEDNADKGYLAKDLRSRGCRVVRYHEDTNKYIKIATHLKGVWPDVVFVDGTDPAYIDQVCDYNETAEHDDAPDSAASIVREIRRRRDNSGYQTILQ